MRCLSIGVLTFACLPSRIEGRETIVIKGSDTLGAKMVPQLAEAYRAAGNEVEFEIEAEGSSSAFTNLLAGECDIGMSSREANPEEIAAFKAKGEELIFRLAAVDMIAVIVNEANPVKKLTSTQVEGIYTGEITNWEEVGGDDASISAYSRNTSSGTYRTFQRLALKDREYGDWVQKMAGGEQLDREVAMNRNGIAYVGLAYAERDGVKLVHIDGIAISPENYAEYPYTRNLYFLTFGKLKDSVAKFLKWATTDPAAREIVEQVGFVAIPSDNKASSPPRESETSDQYSR